MNEMVTGLLAMPGWVQAFMAFFALMVVVMLFGPGFRHRRVAKQFAELAAASGATITPGHDKFSDSFVVERDGRRFTVRRELRDATSGPSYRGPRGYLMYCETPLAGSRWAHHDVDIAEEGSLPPVGSVPFRTGDATFDKRFTAYQSGELGRDGWVDPAVRGAVTAFFDTTPLSGSLWVRAGTLQYVTVAPKGMDATTLAHVLRDLSAVALAFERSAG